MKDNVKIMTNVFRNAMTFEKYTKLWLDASAYIDNLLLINKQRTDNALTGIENEESKLASLEKNYKKYNDNIKKDVKKYLKILFLILGVVSILLICLTVLYALNMKKIFAMLLYVTSPLYIGVAPIIILFIIIRTIYCLHKRKKDRQILTPENCSKEKLVAANNIKSYRSFLEKAKSEKSHLLSKKQYILTEYKKAKNVLDDIYSKGLIPERYQGLVQTATIYGYLYNGICTNIRGHGGVYERYEDDLQRGIIIGLLENISNKLDVVIKNQKEMIKILNYIDSTLTDIKHEIHHSNELLSEINTNTAITAAATQQSAAYQEYIATAVWRNS